MFDDHKIPQQPGAAQVPPNLPMGEPEDMLASVEHDDAPAAPPTPAAPVDAVVPPAPPAAQSAVTAGVLKPVGEAAPPPAAPAPPKRSVPVAPPKPQIPPELQGTIPESSSPLSEPEPPASVAAPVGQQVPPPAAAPAPSPIPVGASGSHMPPPLPQDASYSIKEPTLSRGIMASIIVVVVVLILGGGGWWIYHAVVADKPSTSGTIDSPTVPTTPADGINAPVAPDQGTVGSPATELPPINVDDAVLFGLPADSDGDGLDDDQEATLGLDKSDWDSDDDELSDGDEVIIWETDPKNPDSDGDGYKDGTEVKAGYNPLGPGRIFEAPALTPPAEETAPPVIGGADLPSNDPAAVISQAPFEPIGSCTKEQIDGMVLASIDVLAAQGYTVTADVWQDEIVLPLLVTEVEKRISICNATSTPQ